MELKTAFILQSLNRFNTEAIELMRNAMKRSGVGVTNEGYDSLAYKVFQSGNGAYSNLSFKEYLRFVDMGAGRGHPLGGLAAVTVALQASNKKGLAQVADRIRKPKKIYAKIVYGRLPYLHGRLLYGYTEEAIAMLKAELTNNPINQSP